MPLYKYECRSCGHKFEELLAAQKADEPQKCPACGMKDSKKLLSQFAAVTKSTSTPACGAGGCGSGGFT